MKDNAAKTVCTGACTESELTCTKATYLPKHRKQSKRALISRLPTMRTSLLLLLGFLCLIGTAKAQEDAPAEDDASQDDDQSSTDAQNGPSEAYEKPVQLTFGGGQYDPNTLTPTKDVLYKEDIPGQAWKVEKKDQLEHTYSHKGSLTTWIDSIEPEGGPTTGMTRVTVRGGPFGDTQLLYPKPKCKFGRDDMIVDATYVTCAAQPLSMDDLEGKKVNRTAQCLECDNSPANFQAEIIPFQISLTGDFLDTEDSQPFRYYPPTKVYAIYPRYGPKDGWTFVQVWGDNFLNYDDYTRCNFGSVSVPAKFINSGFLTCNAPPSDVVEKAIPFTVSLNKQQNSREDVNYWYYNAPQVAELVPDYGPDSGGNSVLVKGANYDPFKDYTIDNSNDTFCNFENITKVPFEVINSTKAICVAPRNVNLMDFTYVEITLNNQNYTDDNTPYFYYRPPKIFDIEPREGPTRGNTEIIIFGTNFQLDKDPVCIFDGVRVSAEYISDNKVRCDSPKWPQPSTVDLALSYVGDRFQSDPVKYHYYEFPVITGIGNLCGPVEGYTQIPVYGRNFVDMGFGKAKCVYNSTIFMNATIVNSTHIECDTPPLPHDSQSDWYFIAVTLNNRDVSNSTHKFYYYPEPTIESITPDRGPVTGNTHSYIQGYGFAHKNICGLTIRYGGIAINPLSSNDTHIMVSSPKVNVPDAVVVSVSGNGQQFIDDITMHFRDKENTFTYYQDMLIKSMHPQMGPTSGNTKIVVSGLGFNQFRFGNGTTSLETIFVRFIDSSNGNLIGKVKQSYSQTDDKLFWNTPSAAEGTKAILQLSFNEVDWQSVIPTGKDYSFLYYNAPQVINVNPAYGPVKNPNHISIEISGKNFACPDTACENLYVRFGEEANAIYVKGTMLANGNISCEVPQYTKPDVLTVEVTFNGQDYTNDHQTFGYFDPYILDVVPRLMSPAGTTKLKLIGFGFVDSDNGQLKSRFDYENELNCNSGSCTQQATYINKNTLETGTFPQNQVKLSDGSNIGQIAMTVEASVLNNTFTQNHLEVWYYKEPTFKSLNKTSAPNNIQTPILVDTDFDWTINDYSRMIQHSNFTCKFTVNGKSIVVPARMETLPAGSSYINSNQPSHVLCYSPNWFGVYGEGKLEISVNGQDYMGNLPFTIQEPLDVFRVSPMSGPRSGQTSVKFIGSGFDTQQGAVLAKFGVSSTSVINKYSVVSQSWSQTTYYQSLYMNTKDFASFKHIDTALFEGQTLKEVYIKAPSSQSWSATKGGPIFISVGQTVQVETESDLQTQVNEQNVRVENDQLTEGTDSSEDTTNTSTSNSTAPIIAVTSTSTGNSTTNSTTSTSLKQPKLTYSTQYMFTYSPVEYYQYIQPVVKKVEPTSGLTTGGTKVELSGAWFDEKLNYGVMPFCKFGSKIVRAVFVQTVRIVCYAPPNDNIESAVPLSVSLNGVDFVRTNYTFGYYEPLELHNMVPTSGSIAGGTEIIITGKRFSNITDPDQVKCRFTSVNYRDMQPVFIPAYYNNATSMRCASPPGFQSGDQAVVELTFNGIDFFSNNFVFSFYHITGYFPKSGPSDTCAEDSIVIHGTGFRENSKISCNIGGKTLKPLEVTQQSIKCPMCWEGRDPDNVGSVPFNITIDRKMIKLSPFTFYKQVVLEDMTPHYGPAEGEGQILFYGANFRDDFPNADISCKIGESIGKGFLQDQGTINCTVEEMELVDEGMALPATISLNGQSWATTNQTYTPYGVQYTLPSSGPYTGFSEVVFQGKGFNSDLPARCRFGIEGHSAIVEAEVLDYNKLVCRSPSNFALPVTADEQISIPVGIAFQEEEYKPYTIDLHRYSFYTQPFIESADPAEIPVGKMTEIFVFAAEGSEFWEPVPQAGSPQGSTGIMCRFEHFGDSVGMYINSTTILCVSPSNGLKSDDVYREEVQVTVAMNGQDFDPDQSTAYVTFVGTGSDLKLLSIILFCLLAGALLVAVFFLISTCLTYFRTQDRPSSHGPHVRKTFQMREGDNAEPRATLSKRYSARGSGRASSRPRQSNYT